MTDIGNKYLIQAGNIKQARNYADKNSIAFSDWQYLCRPSQARGLRGTNIKVVRTGTYWKHPEAEEIEYILKSQDIVVDS